MCGWYQMYISWYSGTVKVSHMSANVLNNLDLLKIHYVVLTITVPILYLRY